MISFIFVPDPKIIDITINMYLVIVGVVIFAVAFAFLSTIFME
jgi:hypothetical protein